jgi:hypothetical protein
MNVLETNDLISPIAANSTVRETGSQSEIVSCAPGPQSVSAASITAVEKTWSVKGSAINNAL